MHCLPASLCSCALLTGVWPSFTIQDRSTTSESRPAILKDQSFLWTIRLGSIKLQFSVRTRLEPKSVAAKHSRPAVFYV